MDQAHQGARCSCPPLPPPGHPFIEIPHHTHSGTIRLVSSYPSHTHARTHTHTHTHPPKPSIPMSANGKRHTTRKRPEKKTKSIFFREATLFKTRRSEKCCLRRHLELRMKERMEGNSIGPPAHHLLNLLQ
ncbi:hypothetical protein LY78DRAFT_100401 [Colletotrichum sublineola]|nr:hypothetical protein LY78DRAFT_100401 [Colletotrichum sublineola]